MLNTIKIISSCYANKIYCTIIYHFYNPNCKYKISFLCWFLCWLPAGSVAEYLSVFLMMFCNYLAGVTRSSTAPRSTDVCIRHCAGNQWLRDMSPVTRDTSHVTCNTGQRPTNGLLAPGLSPDLSRARLLEMCQIISRNGNLKLESSIKVAGCESLFTSDHNTVNYYGDTSAGSLSILTSIP